MRIAIAMTVISLTCLAQTTTPKKDPPSTPKRAPAVKPKSGVVSGHIFVITKAGDIKPARLADVYLLPWEGIESSAANRWYGEYHKAGEEYLTKLKESQWSDDSIRCRMELLNYSQATLAVLQWAADDPQKPGKILISQADEEGNFKLANVRSGQYMILASGRAGFNEAYWRDSVTVEPGMETSLKLPSPEKACLVLQ